MLPRNVSPAAERRRSLLIDVCMGILVGIVVVILAAGIGVVGFFALLAALVLVLWYLAEVGLRLARHRRERRIRSARPDAPRPDRRGGTDDEHRRQRDRQRRRDADRAERTDREQAATGGLRATDPTGEGEQ
jgi:hypothetical protein